MGTYKPDPLPRRRGCLIAYVAGVILAFASFIGLIIYSLSQTGF